MLQDLISPIIEESGGGHTSADNTSSSSRTGRGTDTTRSREANRVPDQHADESDTHSPQLMSMTSQIWSWCLDRRLHLTAEHLPGRLNLVADQESRMLGDSSEWKLNPAVFKALMAQLGPCTVDLFASRLTAQ